MDRRQVLGQGEPVVAAVLADPHRAGGGTEGQAFARGVEVQGVSLREPSLDDVFLHETGRSLRDAGPAATEAIAS